MLPKWHMQCFLSYNISYIIRKCPFTFVHRVHWDQLHKRSQWQTFAKVVDPHLTPQHSGNNLQPAPPYAHHCRCRRKKLDTAVVGSTSAPHGTISRRCFSQVITVGAPMGVPRRIRNTFAGWEKPAAASWAYCQRVLTWDRQRKTDEWLHVRRLSSRQSWWDAV